MKVAFLGCIHANLPAFQAALEAAKRAGAAEVVLVGDLVGIGPHPEDVVTLARKLHLAAVAGECDRAVAGAGKAPPGLEASVAWTVANVERATLAWLKGLAPTRRARWARSTVLVSHEPVAGAAEDVQVVAHSHRARVERRPGGRVLVDAGSVGASADGPEATWVLADFDAGAFAIERTAFDAGAFERDRIKAEREYPVVSDTQRHKG